MFARFALCYFFILSTSVYMTHADYLTELATIATQLSDTCRPILNTQFDKYKDLSRTEGCLRLRQDAVLQVTAMKGCTEDEFYSTKTFFCAKVYQQELDAILNGLPARCKTTIQGQLNAHKELKKNELCEKMTTDTDMHQTVWNGGCNKYDFDKVKNVVCVVDYATELAAILDKLSDKCQPTSLQTFEANSNLNKKKDCKGMTTKGSITVALLGGGCTQDEFNTIKGVICDEAYNAKITKAVSKLSSDGCKKTVTSELDKISGLNKDGQCLKMQSDNTIKENILKGGCTEDDYRNVEETACDNDEPFDGDNNGGTRQQTTTMAGLGLAAIFISTMVV